MAETDEQARLIESVLMAEEEKKWGFTYSTLYTNEYGPGAIWLVENLVKKAEYIRGQNWKGSTFIADRIEARVHAMRSGLVGTRSRDARFIDAITVQRTKYAVQGPQEAKGMMNALKQGMGMGGGQPQQQASMF